MYFKKYCERNLEIKFTIILFKFGCIKKKRKKKTENWRRSINSLKKKKKEKEKKVTSHGSFIMVQKLFVWHWLTLQTADEWNLETKHSKDDAKFFFRYLLNAKPYIDSPCFHDVWTKRRMYVSPLIRSLSFKHHRFKLYIHSIANNKNDFVFYK